MEQLMEIRPKLKHNSLFLQTEDGFFVTGEEASFKIKGKSIARWISTLRPLMTGDYTLGQLCAGLEPLQREHVTRIVETLLQKGVVKNRLPEASGILPEKVYNQFRQQIEYIDHFIDYPQEHFRKFRKSSLLLYGSGESLRALALFLLRNGLQNLSLFTTDASDDYVATLEAEADIVRQGGSEVDIIIVPGASAYAFESLDTYDGVIYCADKGSLKEISSLNQQCVREGRFFLAVTPAAGQMTLGPLVRPGEGLCWFCAMMRLSANSDERTQAALWRSMILDDNRPEAIPLPPVARRIGQGLGFELFKVISTCLPSETERGVIFQNLENLESSRSPLARHPLCPVCSHFDPDTAVGQLEKVVTHVRDRSQSDREIYEKHQSLFDRRLGLFTGFIDTDVEQIPLKRTQIIGGSPGSPGDDKLDVTAFSLDTPFSARILALKKAISAYTRKLPDMRGIVLSSQRELAEQGKMAILPQELAIWSGFQSFKAETRSAWLPAISMARNSLVYIPAAAAYPSSTLNSQGMFATNTAGAVAETTFDEVFTRGLLSALCYEHQRALLHGRSTVIDLDLASLDLSDADLSFVVQSARRFERSFALKEVISGLPLTMVIAHTTDASEHPITTFGLELSGKAAVKTALQHLVAELQMLESHSQVSSTMEQVSIAHLLQRKPVHADPQASRLPEPAMEITRVKDTLQQAGRDIIFVHTTSADIWEIDTLICGIVLLTQN